MMEKSNEVKEYMEKCLKESINKLASESIVDVCDTTGVKTRKWTK